MYGKAVDVLAVKFVIGHIGKKSYANLTQGNWTSKISCLWW